MNLLKKTAPWLVASLLLATTGFGDENKCRPQKTEEKGRPQKSYEQGQKVVQAQLMPGYNATARVDVRGSWDLFVTGSFLYWQLAQDNMEVAYEAKETMAAMEASSAASFSVKTMDFEFKPGFKFGLGTNCSDDNWDLFAEYTRLYTSNERRVTSATDVPLLAPWQTSLLSAATVGAFYDTAKAHWHCNLNIGDLNLGRSYYVGTSLTFRPAFGLRSAWIQQSAHYSFEGSRGTNTEVSRTHSWAVGPRATLDTNWLFGQGVRAFGNMGADLLYTKYRLQNKGDGSFSGSGPTAFVVTTEEKCFALRPHTDFELGLGWGSYFDNNNWHVDLSAAYEFQVFFNQNLLRHAMVDFATMFEGDNTKSTAGNLYAQGLTATVRFDF